MNNPLSPMRTECVGRYSLDLPDAVELTDNELTLYFMEDGGAGHRTVRVSVAEAISNQERMDARVQRRASELGSRTHFGTGNSMLVSQERTDDGAVLLTSYTSLDLDTAFDHEVHLLVDHHHVHLQAKSFLTPPEQVITELWEIGARIQPGTMGAATQQGFCLGPVIVNGGHDHEVAQLSYRIREGRHSDLRFEVFFNSFPDPDAERLIRRSQSGMRALGVGRIPELRKRATRMAGVEAEEVLAAPEDSGRTLHAFSAESYPPHVSLRAPTVRLGMFTGGGVDGEQQPGSSLRDAQALALWDVVMQSLTPRSRE
ncbi:T6SS immunity protein Tli4 family protein [Alkalisalibacterium limincola]|uniref:Tle cognate immunity protein 4 C-terminal domain-containing protein n=1 Tax=Alkalisalibacterium limincola TaxID=2699169 RepID=A0A5C8KQN1_9GAMM|nr:T6SS immunity protein Tli4 family protein [Alkalisalibacterium limincola]TXK62305.1 hypothetical protein FU658_08700 [Alkalisalibacterium limincola]